MNIEVIIKELQFKAIRSSGAGGQHVNKVSSKVALSFDIHNSLALAEDEKELLYKSLSSKLTNEKQLILFCDDTRSQHRNKEIVKKRFLELLKIGLKKPKSRKPTKPTKTSIKKRLESKRKQSDKKSSRRKPNLE